MLTTASTPAARSPCARVGNRGFLTPTNASLIRYRQQRSRGFRFGRVWTSNLDPEFDQDTCRRQRKLRYKYSEALNRRVSWDRHPITEDAKAALKRMVHNYWPKNSQPGGRYVNMGAFYKNKDSSTGTRPGQNIEDVERAPMEHLLFGEKCRDYWNSPVQSIRNLIETVDLKSSRTPPTCSSHDLSKSSSNISTSSPGKAPNVGEIGYIIDPITNRKVPTMSSSDIGCTIPDEGGETPISTFKSYRSQFALFNASPVERTQTPILDDEAVLNNHSTSSGSGVGPESSSSSDQGVYWHQGNGIVSPTVDRVVKAKDETSPGLLNQAYVEPSDLHKRKPVMHNQDVSASTSAPRYDDLQKYKPAMLQDEEIVGDELYKQRMGLGGCDTLQYEELDGKRAVRERDAMKQDLEKYRAFRYNEPDGKPANSEESQVDPAELRNEHDPAELRRYQAVRRDAQDGEPLPAEQENSDDIAEVQRYRAMKHKELDAQHARISGDEEEIDVKELRSYGAFRYDEPDSQSATHVSRESEQIRVNKSKSVGWGEPEGNAAAELNSSTGTLGNLVGDQKSGHRHPYLEPTEKEKVEDLDLLRASDVRSASGKVWSSVETAEGKSKYRDMLESLMVRYATASDVADHEAALAIKEARAMRSEIEKTAKSTDNLTGSYARDFPEFSRSWSTTFSPEPHDPAPTATSSPLQPALERQAASVASRLGEEESDSYSKEPQGLQTSYSEECDGSRSGQAYAKTYGNTKVVSESAAETASVKLDNIPRGTTSTPAEPTLYKVLAYDPIMQTINTAETTSDVPDTTSPLTPAEVLLRLSNPARFFPHFAPLQAQGFEIVSGSGDVLVFRRVRPAIPEKVEKADISTSAIATVDTGKSVATTAIEPPPYPSVNPIDMTGIPLSFPDPATARFASPTGFVNYNMPPEPDPLPKTQLRRRFISGIDVRREEPVFSGPKEKSGERRDDSGTRRSLPKRLAVAGVWVAGVSYALGVVGEYFKTGGVDGMGPKGL